MRRQAWLFRLWAEKEAKIARAKAAGDLADGAAAAATRGGLVCEYAVALLVWGGAIFTGVFWAVSLDRRAAWLGAYTALGCCAHALITACGGVDWLEMRRWPDPGLRGGGRHGTGLV